MFFVGFNPIFAGELGGREREKNSSLDSSDSETPQVSDRNILISFFILIGSHRRVLRIEFRSAMTTVTVADDSGLQIDRNLKAKTCQRGSHSIQR